MWLSDYAKAIAAMTEVFGDGCWNSINASAFGDRFIFASTDGSTFVYFIKTERIIQTFRDTWRNSSRVKVIREGTPLTD